MKSKTLYILALLSSLMMFMTSCKKAPLSNGKVITENRNLDSFNTLHINDNIDITLISSDTFKIEITTGENLMDNIITETIDGILFIKNNNTLNWIRSYNIPLEAKIYHKSNIKNITYESVGYLKSDDYIINDNTATFNMTIEDGSGDINLRIKCKDLYLESYSGSSKINLEGMSEYVFIDHYGIGPIHSEALPSDTIVVSNHGTNNIYVQCNKKLNANIYGYGNVYYKGHPEIESYISPNAQGKLIQY